MNIGNCPGCGKLFADNGVGMCMDCFRLEEEQEAIVAEYVRDHPKSSVEQIHEATGVKEKTIFRMIKNGRFVGDSAIGYNCESCGNLIYEGRLCKKCNDNFVKQVQEVASKQPKPKVPDASKKGSGMYTKDM